jgi:hypothetical protein
MIMDEDAGLALFEFWPASESRRFVRQFAHRFINEVGTTRVSVLGSLVTGDIIAVCEHGRILIFLHALAFSADRNILKSEMSCAEFADRLFVYDPSLHDDIYARVKPRKQKGRSKQMHSW